MTPAVFDLGGVLMRYDPRRLYRQLYPEPAELEWFLSRVVTVEWNERMDLSRTLDEGIRELVGLHPDHEPAIRAFQERWHEMLDGAIEPNVALALELRQAGVPLYLLSNCAGESLPRARELFPFLDLFDGLLASGEVGIGKPDPAFFRLLTERFGFPLEGAVFVDDNPANVSAARDLGMTAVHYQGDPDALRSALAAVYPFLGGRHDS